MLYIIGWGVFVLITMRIAQAGFEDKPNVHRSLTYVGIALGIIFVGALAVHYLGFSSSLPDLR